MLVAIINGVYYMAGVFGADEGNYEASGNRCIKENCVQRYVYKVAR